MSKWGVGGQKLRKVSGVITCILTVCRLGISDIYNKIV